MDDASNGGGAPPAQRPGYSYWVSDEQLFAFARLDIEARLRWLEEMREFTVTVAPAESQRHWRRLRGLEDDRASASAELASPPAGDDGA